MLDTVHPFDPATGEYSLISHLPAPLCDAKFFFHGGALYGAGGEDRPASRYSGTLVAKLP